MYHAARQGLAACVAARVVIAVVVAMGLGLAATPQATDSLVTLAQAGRPDAWSELALATCWLALTAWFWARVALTGLPGQRSRALIRPRLREFLPRALGTAVFLAVANGLWAAAGGVPAGMIDTMGVTGSGAGPLRVAALSCAMMGAAFAILTARRVRLRMKAVFLPARALLACTAAIAALGMVLFGTAPLMAAQLLPPLPAILLAASGLICGGTALARIGARTRVPVLAMLLAGAAVLAVLRDQDVLADNHDLPTLPGPARERSGLRAAFAGFLAADDPRAQVPVVMVATAGGGLAAADFTATVLGDLADASPEFSRHIFAISGVSGGALGAAAFVADMAAKPGCMAAVTRRSCLQNALAADFLGPMLGAMLYPDLLQRLLPAVVFDDREAAIEAAWRAQWRHAFGNDRLGGAFLDFWAAGHPWPALMLNGTSGRTGGRLVTSNLALSQTLSADATDLLSLVGGELTATAAIGTSSRFPYISSMGVIRPAPGAATTDWVADGGYFESLGATTLLDVLDDLAAAPLPDGRKVRFVVIEIFSNPSVMPVARKSWVPRGLGGPVSALFSSRGARGIYAAEALARRVKALGGVYVPVRLGQSPTGASAPLGWSLSPAARGVIDAQWTKACRERLLEETGFGAHAATPPAPDTGPSFGAMLMATGCGPVGVPRQSGVVAPNSP